MKRLLIWLVVLVALFLLAPALTYAQDSGAPAEGALTRAEIVLIGALFVALAVFALAYNALLSLARRGFELAPPWVVESLLASYNRAIAELERVVTETPTTIDDEVLKQLRRDLDRLLSEARTPPDVLGRG